MAFLNTSQDERQPYDKKSRQKKAKVTSQVRQHFLLMAGLGIDAAVMGHVSQPLKYRVGALAVGISTAKELPAQRSFPVEIRAGEASDAGVLWKGEALQVVVGNTRLYADIVQMTPAAYIDDGLLDVCVITAGNPLTTMQQLASLLLRHHPDNLTAEYFQGAHLSLSVPASIALQLDGSAVKLKDYLSKSDRKALAQAGHTEQVMVTYRFDAMPRALKLAIPRTYDDALFEASDSAHHQQAEITQAPAEQEPREETQQKDEQSQEQQSSQQSEQVQREERECIKALLEHGQKVTVVGVGSNPAKKDVYIVAGSTTKQSTGEARPVAVRIDQHTTVRRQTGETVVSGVLPKLHEGETIVVKGWKSKRGVIWAKYVVI